MKNPEAIPRGIKFTLHPTLFQHFVFKAAFCRLYCFVYFFTFQHLMTSFFLFSAFQYLPCGSLLLQRFRIAQ